MAKKKKAFQLPSQEDYPKSITYDSETYHIVFKKHMKAFATTNSNSRIIKIRDGLPPRLLLATLIHEILHVIEFEYPLKLKHKTVFKLEEAITEIILDNFL